MGVDAARRVGLDARQANLLIRTPIAAEHVRYVGREPEAFAEACRARNPRTEVGTGAQAARVEVLVAEDLGQLIADSGASDLMGGADLLVAAIPPAPIATLDAQLAAVAGHGFEILQLQTAAAARGYFDDWSANLAPAWQARALPEAAGIQSLVVIARRAPTRPLLHLHLLSFAPNLMDIRTRMPADAMRTEPDLVVAHQKTPARLPPIGLDQPKVLVMQRPATPDPAVWRQGIAQHVRSGWIVVLEYDDHPELVARFNGRPVTEASWLRFTGVHAVQTTTQPLVELFERYNPEVRRFPNAAFRLEPFPEILPRRVFYGAISRGPFAAEVAGSLDAAVAEFPDTAFEVVGDRAVFDALPTANKRYHEFMAYEDYLALMATCSVSLSPMEGSEHQETKSDAKFLDAAARGVLTIASPAVYSGVVRHGRNGLIAQTVADWAPLLARALRDEAGNRLMARNAWDYVSGARMFADQIRLRHDWYRDLWARRAELDAALLARLAG